MSDDDLTPVPPATSADCNVPSGKLPSDPEHTLHLSEPHEEDGQFAALDPVTWPVGCATSDALYEYTSIEGVTVPPFNTQSSFRVCRATKFAAGMCLHVSSGTCQIEVKVDRIETLSDGTGNVYFKLSSNPINLVPSTGSLMPGPIKVWQVNCFTGQEALCTQLAEAAEAGDLAVWSGDTGDPCTIQQRCLKLWKPQDPDGLDEDDNPACGVVYMKNGVPHVLFKTDHVPGAETATGLVGFGSGCGPTVLAGGAKSSILYWEAGTGLFQLLEAPAGTSGTYNFEVDLASANKTPTWVSKDQGQSVIYVNKHLLWWWVSATSPNVGTQPVVGTNKIVLEDFGITIPVSAVDPAGLLILQIWDSLTGNGQVTMDMVNGGVAQSKADSEGRISYLWDDIVIYKDATNSDKWTINYNMAQGLSPEVTFSIVLCSIRHS